MLSDVSTGLPLIQFPVGRQEQMSHININRRLVRQSLNCSVAPGGSSWNTYHNTADQILGGWVHQPPSLHLWISLETADNTDILTDHGYFKYNEYVVRSRPCIVAIEKCESPLHEVTSFVVALDQLLYCQCHITLFPLSCPSSLHSPTLAVRSTVETLDPFK